MRLHVRSSEQCFCTQRAACVRSPVSPSSLTAAAGRLVSGGTLASIEISPDYSVQVDDDLLEELSKHRWRLHKGKHTHYAVSTRGLMMHRLVIQATKGVLVDHINGDGLDNRRANLRLCSNAQNMMNARKIAGRSSRFKGVSWNKDRNQWYSTIEKGGKRTFLGGYREETRAAKQYDRAARLMFGRFAKTNEMLGLYNN